IVFVYRRGERPGTVAVDKPNLHVSRGRRVSCIERLRFEHAVPVERRVGEVAALLQHLARYNHWRPPGVHCHHQHLGGADHVDDEVYVAVRDAGYGCRAATSGRYAEIGGSKSLLRLNRSVVVTVTFAGKVAAAIG